MEFWQQTWRTWTAGGPLLLPLALVSVGLWAYFLRSRNRLSRITLECRELEPRVAASGLEHLEPVGVGQLLLRIHRDILGGVPPRTAFHRRGDTFVEGLRHDLIILSALTAVAPLLGLLGTVRGMIDTFQAVSQVAGETGLDVASGISQALITTQFGLVIALPGVFGISRLRALLRDVEARLGTLRAAALPHVEAPV